MKFLSMTITLSKGQYVITNQITVWQKLAVLLKVLLIICLSLQSGYEHIHYTVSCQLRHQFEAIAVTLMTALIAPNGRAYYV